MPRRPYAAIPARNVANLTSTQLTHLFAQLGAQIMSSEVRRRLLRHRHFAVHRFEMIGMKSDEKTPAGVTTLGSRAHAYRTGLRAGKRPAFV